jgi:carbonic anhydrase
MKTLTKEVQENLSPKQAYDILVAGNQRFVDNVKAQRNLKDQVLETKQGQYPFAVVLSCIDSRVPAELVFDQGIGDIFSVRVAGNVVNEDILGSMEYACKVAGSKIVLVMGHTKCGAVTAACQDVKLGNVTQLLKKIKPAFDSLKKEGQISDVLDVDAVAARNVQNSISHIRKKSEILSSMESAGEIHIVGALYDVSNGVVTFL